VVNGPTVPVHHRGFVANNNNGEPAMAKQLLLMVASGLFLATDQPNDETAKEDMKRLQGTWEIVAGAHSEGKEPSNLLTKNNLRWVIIKGDTVKVQLRFDEVTIDEGEWRFKLYPSRKPKQFEFKFEGKKNWLTTIKAKEPFKGIYTLDKDTLKLCSAWITGNGSQPQELPKDFSAKPLSGRVLLILKRAKP
jgi:uncharacterized protein (TIGR03067 family)